MSFIGRTKVVNGSAGDAGHTTKRSNAVCRCCDLASVSIFTVRQCWNGFSVIVLLAKLLGLNRKGLSMEATNQGDKVLDRAITVARHLRHGELAEALQPAKDLRSLLDGICRELTLAQFNPKGGDK